MRYTISMPTPLTEEAKKKISDAYSRFHKKIVSIKHDHFHQVDAIQKEADEKLAASIKQRIESR